MRRTAAITALSALVLSACLAAPRDDAIDETPASGEPTVRAAAARDPATIRVSFHRKASGLDSPVAVVSSNDGTGRLFIVEQQGRIRIWHRGSVRATPYLSITGRVQSGGEQGMLGLAFHPNFKTNRFFYVSYTDGQGDLRIARFRGGSRYTSNRADAGSQRILLQVAHREYSNHNAGQLNFGSKYLFISTGDGGGGGDPDDNAQKLANLKGKILRINVDASCGSKRYCSPRSNPFWGSTPGKAEIYHYGLRNPWRFSFDRATGTMWIADVGQNSWEEVSVAGEGVKGLNFGWDCREGRHAFESSPYCEGQTFKGPRREYARTGGRAAVIGGYVYRGSADPELRGIYVHADYGSGEVWGTGRHDGRWKTALIGDAPGSISSFGEAANGELYAVTLDGGLYRVRARIA